MPNHKRSLRLLNHDERRAIQDLNAFDRQIRDLNERHRSATQHQQFDVAWKLSRELEKVRKARQVRQMEFVSIRVAQGRADRMKPRFFNWKKIKTWFSRWRIRRKPR